MTAQASVVAIGVFDGVHLGHQALTAQTASVAVEYGVLPRALTFYPHPMSVVRGMTVNLLVSLDRRVELLREAGMHDVYICEFDRERAAQTAEQFIDMVLKQTLGASHVVVGRGFRFGRGASGTADTLREAGLHVHEVEQVNEHGGRVSSTRIRELIASDNLDIANELPRIEAALQGLIDISVDVIESKKTSTDDDFITNLVRANVEGDALTYDELLNMVSLLIFGGFDTTRNQLGCAVNLFAQHPEQWALLAEQPDLAQRAVEEAMRYFGAVRGTARFASVDIEYKIGRAHV